MAVEAMRVKELAARARIKEDRGGVLTRIRTLELRAAVEELLVQELDDYHFAVVVQDAVVKVYLHATHQEVDRQQRRGPT